MKKFLFLLVLGFMLRSIAIAQPNLKFEKRNYTFSLFQSGKKYYYRFKIKNTGSSPLFISFVRLTDPKYCTVDWPQSVIQPGEENFITVHINLVGYTNSKLSNSIMVYSNCPSPGNFKTLDFSAKVKVPEVKEKIDKLSY